MSGPRYYPGMALSISLSGFIQPCLPSRAERPPSGGLWLHEIKHDGFRIIARKDGARVRLYSRPGNDLTDRFPLIVEALARLRSRSCIIDGEAVCCDNDGRPSFDRIRYRRHDASVFLYAFDLIELNGDELRRDRLGSVRRRWPRCCGRPGLASSSTSTLSTRTSKWSSAMPASSGWRASCPSGKARLTALAAHRLAEDEEPGAPAVKREADEDWDKNRWR